MSDATPSAEYTAALETMRAAGRKFAEVQDAYRAGNITDTAYLAARKEYGEAEVVFDAAIAAEEAREVEEEPATEDAGQLDAFA